MKHTDNTGTQSDAPITEIEYTPIRRKSAETSTISVSADEISVVSPSAERPTASVAESEPTVQESAVSAQPEEELAEGPVLHAEESAEEHTEAPVVEEVADEMPEQNEAPEQAPVEDTQDMPQYEHIILPDEISLADVLPLMEEAQESEEAEAAGEALTEDIPSETTESEPEEIEEEEFVLTPIPEPVVYERVVLPDEISLVDILNEIRPQQSEESAPTPEAEAPTQEFILPDDILCELSTDGESVSEESDEAPSSPIEGEAEEAELPLPEEITLVPYTQDADEEQAHDEDESVEETQPEAPDEQAEAQEEIAPEQNGTADTEVKARPIENRFDMVELFAFTLAFVLLLTTFFFRSSAVNGSSMEGTLHHKDQLILYSFMYEPKVGDIVVFEDYSTGYREPLVKRVIATEGQTVEIYDTHTVIVDGVRLKEDYIFLDGYDATNYPIIHTVAEGHIFVMGDHRNGSSDSRIFRDVSVDTVLGKVILRYYPFDTFTKFN